MREGREVKTLERVRVREPRVTYFAVLSKNVLSHILKNFHVFILHQYFTFPLCFDPSPKVVPLVIVSKSRTLKRQMHRVQWAY